MGYSVDHVRRELRESQLEHASAIRAMRDVVGRLFGVGQSAGAGANGPAESAAAKADFMTSGLNRRGFLRVGGVTIAAAAVFAACGGDDGSPQGANTDEDDGEDDDTAAAQDILILRTASSLEALAFDVYQRAIDSGLVTSTAVIEVAKLFQTQHKEHGDLFQGATKEAGGEPFTTPNPALMQQLQPAIAALRDEAGVVRLAYDLENVAAATYYSTAGGFEDADLNRVAMSVGGVEARHAAVLAAVLSLPQVPRSFQTAEGAVAAGTGVS